MRRRSIVIACAVIPWVVTIVRSWPASQRDERRAPAEAPRAADPWQFAGCPPELGRELRPRPYWAMQAIHADRETSFIITARASREHREYEWLLEPAQRASLLENLRAQCAAGKVERLADSLGLAVEDPMLLFSPATSSHVVLRLQEMTLRFESYGATAR